jgi:hypothetical protein
MFCNVAIYQKYFLLIVPFGARTLVTEGTVPGRQTVPSSLDRGAELAGYPWATGAEMACCTLLQILPRYNKMPSWRPPLQGLTKVIFKINTIRLDPRNAVSCHLDMIFLFQPFQHICQKSIRPRHNA